MAKQYKYQCRPCPPDIRCSCIEQAQMSQGVKRIIQRAFESHTDTQATWDLLQRTCLLVQRDEMIAGRQEVEQHGLLSRMQRHREEQAPPEEAPPPVVKPPERVQAGWQPNWDAELRAAERESGEVPQEPIARPKPQTPSLAEPITGQHPQVSPMQEPVARRKPQTPSMLDHLVQFAPARSTDEIPELDLGKPPRAEEPAPMGEETPSPTVTVRYPTITPPARMPMLARGPRMLVIESTGHRILLEEDRELTLGRFDPLTQVTPDVDLTFEDRLDRGVSRRHCQVSGWRGSYEIVDLGSSNGTWINGVRLQVQETHTLEIGDEVRLGNCRAFFDRAPAVWESPPPSGHYFLYLTFSGRYYPLSDQHTFLIGRTDPSLGYVPDIDLTEEGDVASVVSRRHAQITHRGGEFVIEDLGSAYKTRVNGESVPVGIQVSLRPGQHLWLGGCILAFDVVEG